MRKLFCLAQIFAMAAWNPVILCSQTAEDIAMQARLHAVSSAVESTDPFALLQKMANRFGPRLTGSESEHQAVDWAVHEMRHIGLSNVHTESWTLTHGWKRQCAIARLLQPYRLDLTVASYGWTGSTPGLVSGDVILVDGTVALSMMDSRSWANKIVLLDPISSDRIAGVAEAPSLARIAERSHALAIIDGIDRPGADLLHTGPLGFPAQDASIPVLDMPREQRQLLINLIRNGITPRVQLDISTRFSNAPVQERNVVGEIEGTRDPAQVVLLGAHLDSWDLSSGATDDGVGVAAVLDAARAIRSSGVRPSRTIRFVLFAGEEEGLLGSRAYVEQHKTELPNLICALVLDWGTGPIVKFPLAGHPEMKQPLEGLFASGEGLENISAQPGYLMFTDAFAFTLAGVPGLAPLQDSPAYDDEVHSTADNLDKVNASALHFNTKVLALSGIWLADVAQRPGTLYSLPETQQSLASLRKALQMLNLWTF